MAQFTLDTWPESWGPSFSFDELACRETGQCVIDEDMMDRLQDLRERLGKPVRITSGYRSPEHYIEAAKAKPGAHATGCAVDISCSGDSFEILRLALELGFTGIGVSQNGDHRQRFLHLDTIQAEEFHAPRPALWSY